MGKIIIDSFFPQLTLATLDALGRYFEMAESQLQSVRKKEYDQTVSEIKGLGLSPEEKWIEWDLAMQEHAATHDMLYTHFLRYSFVVLLHLILEDKLREFCGIVGGRKGKTPPAAERSIVKAYKRFLERAGVSVEQQVWKSVHDLNKVRNCIVHASGNVGRARDEKHPRSLARRDPNLAISGDEYESEGLPLYLEEDMLMLTPDYCNHAVADVKRLFENLCCALPLRGIVIEENAP